MKKLSFFNFLFGSLAVAIFFFSGCAKSSDSGNNGFVIPDAQAAQDNKSGGIYKGTIVGSTGSFAIVLQDNVYKVYLTLDSVQYTLTTTATITSGSAITGVVFTGSGISLTFTVDANGANPVVSSLTIPAHPNAAAVVLKHTTTAAVMVFEGRYTKTTGASSDHCTGNINFIVNGSRFIADYKEDVLSNPTSAGSFSGNYSGSNINTTLSQGEVVAVTISSNQQNITGTITSVCSSSVSCKRTM